MGRARLGRGMYDAIVRDEFEPMRRRLEAEAARDGWLKPQAVYGYFPAQSDGNAIIVYDPAAFGE